MTMPTTAPDTPETRLDEGDLRLARTAAPAVICIFGATGDLTARKLLPGLYNLAVQQLLPPRPRSSGWRGAT
jgi:hypothetical protein